VKRIAASPTTTDSAPRCLQIKDALGGLTFSKTPSFNYTSLQESPLTYTDRWGDDRNTTYGSPETVAAPPLTSYYGRVRQPSLEPPPLRVLPTCCALWHTIVSSYSFLLISVAYSMKYTFSRCCV
jgi:hypothetical protein